MASELDGKVVLGIDLNSSAFRRQFGKLPIEVRKEAKETLKSLLMLNLDEAPKKLHLHPLTSKQVPSRNDTSTKVKAWSLHLTADDKFKASFTFEDGTMYFRTCGKHDDVDKNP